MMMRDERYLGYASGATSIASAIDPALWDDARSGVDSGCYPPPLTLRDPGKLSYEKHDLAPDDLAAFSRAVKELFGRHGR
jgi:hypothetical protein